MNGSRNIVLVGTYRPANEAWIRDRRLYNLPLPKCGMLAFHEKISGVVLFAEGHPNFAFKAKFKDVVDGTWLKKNGYSLSAKPHGEKYALYELCEESTPAKLLGRKSAEVFVSSSRCPVVKIDESFYSKPYPVTGGKSMPYVFDCLKPYFRKWKSATTFNPVQEDFFQENFGFDYGLQVARGIVAEAKHDNKLTCVEICAGAGGQALGLDEAERYLRNRVEYYYVDHPGELKVIDRSIGSIDCSDNLPYDMKFYRPEEVVRELAVE